MPQPSSPKLSVLIPTYNRQAMLDRCLESMHQIVADCEFVVVDNASPDETAQVVARHQERDPRVQYFRNATNVGIPANFNVALERARGEYLCVMGDDDQAVPESFVTQLNILETVPSVGCVYGMWHEVDAAGNFVRLQSPWHATHSYVGNPYEIFQLLPGNYINLLVAVFRRDLLDRFGGFDLGVDVFCDWDMFLRYFQHTETAFVNKCLGRVATHPDSDSNTRGSREGPRCKLAVWRRHLLENDEHVAVGEPLWQRMRRFFEGDLTVYQFDGATRAVWLDQFDALREEYRKESARRFSVPSSKGGARSVKPSLSVILCGFETERPSVTLLEELRTSPAVAEVVRVGEGRAPAHAGAPNLPSNWNQALRKATGEFITILGPDTLSAAATFEEKLALLLARPDIEVAYSGCAIVDGPGGPARACNPGLAETWHIGCLADVRNLLRTDGAPLECLIFRREVLARLGGFDEHLPPAAASQDLVFRYLAQSTGAYMPEPRVLLARQQRLTATETLDLWQNWLFRTDPPPIIDERLFLEMQAALLQTVNQEAPFDVNDLLAPIQRLASLRYLHLAGMDGRVHPLAATRSTAHLHDSLEAQLFARGDVTLPAEWVIRPLLQLANDWFEANRPEMAYDVAAKAYELAPRAADTTFTLAVLGWKRGMLQESLRFARELLQVPAPESYQSQARRIIFEAAQRLLVEALSGPVNGLSEADVILGGAAARGQLGDVQAQYELLAAGLQRLPHDARVRKSLIELLETHGQPAEAARLRAQVAVA